MSLVSVTASPGFTRAGTFVASTDSSMVAASAPFGMRLVTT